MAKYSANELIIMLKETEKDIQNIFEKYNNVLEKDTLSFLKAKKRRLKQLKNHLMSLQRKESYFGMQTNDGMSLGEVAEVFNVSRERVRQLEEAALKKIKHPRIGYRLSAYLKESVSLSSKEPERILL